MRKPINVSRRRFIGGSDARIIMGDDEGVLLRLWREKRGEVEPGDLSGNVIVQLGLVTEDLNRRWYEAITGQMPAGLYILVVCYATAVIFLGWLPWNILLILFLFLFLCGDKRLRFIALDTASSAPCSVTRRGGSSV